MQNVNFMVIGQNVRPEQRLTDGLLDKLFHARLYLKRRARENEASVIHKMAQKAQRRLESVK
jgi:hypothetical protein